MRVLAVDVDQLFAQFAQLPQRDGQSVDEGAAAPLAIDDPAQHQRVVEIEFVFLQPGMQAGGRIEDGLKYLSGWRLRAARWHRRARPGQGTRRL